MPTTPVKVRATFLKQLIPGLALLAAIAGIGASILLPRDALAIANADTCETSHAGLNGDEMAIIDGINEERVAEGLPPYLVSASMSQAAGWMAEDVGSTGSFSHTDSEGRSPFQRGQDCVGISMGENLAAGFFGGPSGVVAAWMASPGHRGAILHGSYVTLGVGIYGNVYVANFAGSSLDGVSWIPGGSPPPPPPPADTPTPEAELPPPPTGGNPPSVPQPKVTLPPPGNAGRTTGSLSLSAGVNLVTYTGESMPITEALGSVTGQVAAVYQWDASTRQWQRYFPQKPAYINSLTWMAPGDAYFIVMNTTTTWYY